MRKNYEPAPIQIMLKQLDYLFINKKWMNSILNCEAYCSFEGISTDHRIISAKIRLNLCRKKKLHIMTSPHLPIYIYIYIHVCASI